MAGNKHTLTQEEQDFASEHHNLIMVHLAVNRLQFEDWYDVLVFGYLKAVRAWFRRPQVRRWTFATIAKVEMRSAMLEQFRFENRAMRKGVTISLDAPLEENKTTTLHGLSTSAEDVEEQAVFEMMILSMGSGLNAQEKAVLRLLFEGYNQVEISRELGLSRKTVAQALSMVRTRWHDNRKSEAV